MAINVASHDRPRIDRHRTGVDSGAAAVGTSQPAIGPAVIRDVLDVDELGAAEVDAWFERCAERLAAVGDPFEPRGLNLPHGHAVADGQHDNLAARQIGLLIASRHARVGDADRDFGATDVVPVGVARDPGVIDRLEAAAEVVLDPEVQVGVIAAARVGDGGFEVSLGVGGDHRHLVAAEPPPPVRPVDTTTESGACSSRSERLRTTSGELLLQAELQFRRQLDGYARRQRLRIETDARPPRGT